MSIPSSIDAPPDVPTAPATEASACPLVGMLLAQAQRTPGQLAVVCGASEMTYGELVRRINALARALRAQGAGPGTFVGMAIGRSLELPVALWGIVASGAAYVPLDPGYPQTRLDHMLESARLSLVVTTRCHASRFPGSRTVIIDDLADEEITEPLMTSATPDDPLYAIFTSGSTGQPKAATVFRRGFINLLNWYRSEFIITEADRFLIITSPSFDLTQKNLYAPLLAGGRLVLDSGEKYDLARIRELLRKHGITVINCTPSAFEPLVGAAATDAYSGLSNLRFAILGGEAIQLPRLRNWLLHPSCRAEVANTYGPTECTDICAFHRLHRGNLYDSTFVPLGREIHHVQVAVLDEDLRPLPTGETGELWIGGAGIGGGYLHDPDRTAERFVANRLPDLFAGPTIYRTGDLARRGPDGILEFRGRIDHQVKVRGFRIELGEIESALIAHPEVHSAVVLAREFQPGDHRLLAWIVPSAMHDSSSADRLRAFLEERLPAHMVPTRFRFIESFPLTPNGKIDRLAMAAMSGDERPCTPPTTATATEQRLLEMWSDVLGQSVSDPTANFFDLGASSIHLAVMHARIMEAFATDFPITEMFAHTTARSLANFLSPSPATNGSLASIKSRARLQQQAFSRFQPSPR